MSKLPPGPKGRVFNTLRVMKDTPAWMRRWRERYGDPFFARTLNGDVVVTGRPDLIKPMLTLGEDDFVPFGTDAFAPLVGRASLLTTAGERHKRDRKLLMPPFHGERMRTYGAAMHERTLRQLDALPEDEVFSMLSLGHRITLDVIMRVVFGVEEEERLARYGEGTTAAMDAANPIFFFARVLQKELFGPWARFLREQARGRALLQEQIDRTRARAEPGDDVLSLMLEARYDDGAAMPDDEVMDQLITLLLAGHETTAIALSWAMYFIHKDPDVKARLLEELASVAPEPAAWAALPYLRAVCDEALRIHPIVPEMMRKLTRPLAFGAWELPAGMTVSMSATLLHSNEAVYPDPARFLPERFLERTFGPHEYLPFGGGNRRCIGAAFAHYEMRVALGTMLTQGSFELLDDGDVKPARRTLTLAPHTGVRMRWRRHRDHARQAA